MKTELNDHSSNSPNPNQSSSPHQMNMLFHFGAHAHETFLFHFWNISSGIGIFFASFFILILCFLLEFIGWYQNIRKQQRCLGGQNKISTINATGNRIGNENKNNKVSKRLTKETIVDALIHGIHLTLGNLLMVIFMSLNIWLCGAVIFGQIIARFIFSHLFPQIHGAFEADFH